VPESCLVLGTFGREMKHVMKNDLLTGSCRQMAGWVDMAETSFKSVSRVVAKSGREYVVLA
jgi:hypothetical protein